ncbi:MAG: lytic murein transglycosylase, partial [Gluconacetobacter diazotrophicus]|nr:lytic murein transglycosylase [Gluconacetobacter diazotrophicus]
MITRRAVSASLLLLPAAPALGRSRSAPRPSAAGGSYSAFLSSVRADAVAHGVPDAIAAEALALSAPNAKVLQLDRHQPEFTLTWSQYQARVITPT